MLRSARFLLPLTVSTRFIVSDFFVLYFSAFLFWVIPSSYAVHVVGLVANGWSAMPSVGPRGSVERVGG